MGLIKNTPVLVRQCGEVIVKAVEDIANFKTGECESVVDGVEVYSGSEWSSVKKVTRYKTPNQKVYQVHCMHGTVVVTEDCLLLDSEGNGVSPLECGVHKRLKRCYPVHEELNDLWTKQDVIEYYSTRLRDKPSNTEFGRMYYFQKKFPDLTGDWASTGFRFDEVYNQGNLLELCHMVTSDYVYKVHTESGLAFQAGIGELAVVTSPK